MTGICWTAASFEVLIFSIFCCKIVACLTFCAIYFFSLSFRRPNSSSSALFWHITDFIHSFQQQPICPNVFNFACFYDSSNFFGSTIMLLHAAYFPAQYNVFAISSWSSSHSACYIVFCSSLYKAFFSSLNLLIHL